MIHERDTRARNILNFCKAVFLCSFLSFLCYLAALSSAIIWIQTIGKTLVIFVLKQSNMSLYEALHRMLAFMPVEVLVKDIQLEMVIQDH